MPRSLKLGRNLGVAAVAGGVALGALGLFALLFYVVTIVKLGPGVLNRPL